MREIKFRGKREDNGEWVYGDLIRHYENQRRFIACDQLAFTYSECGIDRLVTERFYEVAPETVGQYTGLLDRRGKEIYEGDVLRTHFSFEHEVIQEPFVITWNKERAMFEGQKPDHLKKDYLKTFSFFPEQRFIYEVIGNIHEQED